MEKTEIIDRLRHGWELANRGAGWWISAPRIAYRTTETIKVDDALVEQMEKEGLVKTELPYNTIWARLVD